MSKISTYEVTPVPKLADKLIGTSVGGEIEDITYNFTLSELLNLFIPNIPANTLQGVLDYGNTATQDIILNGTIFTTYLEVTDTATILNSYLTEETHIAGSLYDRLDSAGTAGQVLRSTGTQVEWYSIPNVIPTLQQVLAAGNTADINIILSSNIQALTATANNVVSNTSLSVNGTLKDKDASVGTAGQVLSSTGIKVQWIALPVYTATSPLSIDSITRVISIQQASASQNGYLSSADWITFDGKQGSISLTTIGSSGPSTLVGSVINVPNYTLSGLGGVPQTRTLTINGVTYNLSADRTWTIAAGVSSVTATTPLFSTGGVNPDISIQQSSSSLDGYLSNVDWLTFNSKQPAGNYITSLTGEATAAGPGAASVILSNAAVIGKLLTGLNITGGTVVSTDSILTAFGKVQNQINSLVGGVIYKGVWNAATNTPTLVSSVGVQGNYYIVNVAGNTNLNGITDWNVGDWAIFNGSTWNKVDNTDLVTSVNGQVGAVSLTTDNIPEGATNLYYLNSRARAALSFAAGSGAYNSTTGVITIPTDNSQILNGAGYITLVSLSATSPLSYNNTTGAFSIQVANTTQNGYLSSTDWNTFNGKQPFLGGTGLVKSVAGVISYITDNSANWNTAYNDSIISAAVTGTSTKTLTLNQQDAGTITASWTDLGLTSVGVSMPSAFSVANSPLTSNGTIAVTGAGTTLQYIDGTGALRTFPGLTGYVPYTGATTDVDLGAFKLNAQSLHIKGTAGNGHLGLKHQSASATASANEVSLFADSLGDLAWLNGNLYLSKFITSGNTAARSYTFPNATGTIALTSDISYPVTSVFGRAGAVIAVSGDYTTTLVPEGTNLYYLDSRARAAVSLTTTGTSGASTYNSTTGVFNIPNYGAALSGYVPTSRTLNINGTSYDLSADRSWSVGTVTSVAALTLGTTGTDLSSSVATGTTTPVITLNVPTASAANRGALSAADWSTFNAKVSGVTATSPLASSGGTTPNITIQQSSGSQAGFLSAADWTTFNNKQAAGNYITSLTGEATATGPGAASVTLSNSAVTAKVLTGINITGGTVIATDSILTGFGKLQNQINSLIGSTIYKGTWNASTNTPTLTSGVGTRGWYYIVSVAGTTNLDGITDWFVGDWAIFDGTAWQQVDNTDAVVSVNGFTGAVSLTTDNIPEGTTNLYYTNTRARAALSFTAGSGAYNSTTGVITIPTNNNQITNGSNYITLASLSGTAPISYNSGTGAISITQSGTASNGYLSSTDWNTFNNKQAALTNPVLASGAWTSGYLPKINGSYTITNSIAYDGGSSLGINTNAPYDSTQFKLDVNGGLIVKNASGVAAQIVLIDANPASGGNAGFSVQSVGGTLTDSWYQLQTYYGTSVAAGALRLQPSTGQILIGSTTVSAFKVDITGTLRLSGQLTLGSTITNGTYTYTLPGASGTLALTSQLTGGTVTSVAALTIGTIGTDLSSTVANSTTTPVITLNVPTASAANRGALSAADWTIFNNKQNALTNPVTGTGTANYLARWTSSSVIGTGVTQDNGTNVWVGSGASTSSRMTVNQNTGFASPVVLRIENDNTTQSESAIRLRANSSGGSFAHADVGVYATGADTGKFFIKFPWSDSQQVNVKFSITETGVIDMVNYFNVIRSGGFYSLIKSTGASESVGLNLGNNNIAKWGMHIQTTDRFAIFNYGTSTAPLSIDYSTNYIYALQRIGVNTATPSAGIEISESGFNTGLAIITSSINGADIRLKNTGSGGRDWNITSTGSNNDTGAGNLQFYDSTASLTRFVIKGTSEIGISVNPSVWGSSFKVLQIGQTGSLHQNNTGYETRVSNNMYWDGTNWKYLVTSSASLLNLTAAGGLSLLTAASGTAGTNITLSTVFSVTQAGALTATGDVYIQNSNASAYSRLWLQNIGASGRQYIIGVGGNTSARANLFYINDATSDLTRLILTPEGQFAMGGQLAGGGALLTLDQNYTQIVSPTVLRLQNSNSISQMRIRGLNGGYYAHADVGVYADGTAADTGYWFVKFPYSDGLTNIQLKITQTGAATFSNTITAGNTFISSMGNNSQVFRSNSGTTGYMYSTIQNSGGNLTVGIDQSTGGALANNTVAYSAVLGNAASAPTHLISNNYVGLTLTPSLNVGIGTTSPFSIADINTSINGTGSSALQLGVGGTRTAQFYASSTEVRISTVTNIPLRIYTNDTEKLRVTENGTLGFNGSASPNNALLDKMSMGYLDSNYGWIQTWSGTNLVLNPQGNNVSIGTTFNGGNKLYIANGTIGNIPIYIDLAYSGSTPFFGGVLSVRSNSNTVNEGAGYHIGALRADFAVVEYGGIGVQIESNGNSTWSGKTSLLITENGTVRVAKATLSSQLGFVVNPGLTSSTFSSSGNQSLSGTNKFTAAGGSTWSNGGTWAGTVGTNIINFSGSNTISAGAIVAGFIGVNRIAFDSASLTVTLNQSTGIRALAGMQTLMQTGGSNAGTVSHGASLLVQGVYPTGSANITFTNYYGVLINPLDEWGTVTFTNRWGIYQAGSSDKNYFAGIMQKPNQPTFSVKNSAQVTISADAKLAFDSTYFNVGSGYNTSNYRYTAPYTGKYLMTFEASCVSGGAHTYNAVYIVKNGTGTSFRFRGPSNIGSGGWFGISGSVVMDLTAGDYLELNGYTDSSYIYIQTAEGCWSGYYLG